MNADQSLMAYGFVETVAKDYDWTAEDVWMLARAIQGEGAALFGRLRDEVGLWIASTAINRTLRPWWDQGIAKETETAFHGCKNVARPAPWAVAVALAALLNPNDIARGCIFMLSGKDLHDQGLACLMPFAERHFYKDGNELYFFTFNPWNPPNDLVERNLR